MAIGWHIKNMEKKTVFVKTNTGISEVSGQSDALYGDAKRILQLVDDESTVIEISKRVPPSLRESLNDVLQELVDGGYIRDAKAPSSVPQKPALKMATPSFKMASPKVAPPAASGPENQAASPAMRPESKNEESVKSSNNGDLDFSFITAGSSPGNNDSRSAQAATETESAANLRQVAERLKAEQLAKEEAAAKAAKLKAYEDAKIKAKIEVAARARIEAAAREKQVADEARLKAEQAALKARSETEAAKARIEAEVRARIEAETKVRQEAEAIRIKAEKEAERLRQELEAARVKAENEMKIRLEAEARAKAEAAARMKREAEAERLRLEKERAELEVARVKVEAEIKMRAEAEARVRSEVEARLKAEELARHDDNRGLGGVAPGAGESAERAREDQVEQAEKLRQSFVESFGQDKKKQQDYSTGSFKLEQFSFVDTGKIAALSEQPAKPAPLPGSSSKVKAVIEERARKEAEAKRIMAEQELAERRRGQDEAARAKAQQDEAASRAKAEQESIRLKAEHEAYRLKVAQEEERVKAEAEAQKLTASQSKQWEDAQRRAAIQAQAEKEREAKQAAEAQLKARQKSARAPRKPLPVGKVFAGLFVLALMAVAGLPYIWPMDEYIAPLEKEISAQIKQPVHIGKIHFALLPLPRLEMKTVAIGKAEELKVADVAMNFDFSALFAPTKSINKIELNNITVAGASLDKVLIWLQAAGGIDAYPVAQIELNELRVSGDDIKLPVFSGKAEFDPQGKFTHAVLKSADAKLGIELKLLQNNLLLEVNLKDGSLPIFPGIKFNDASIHAVVANGEAVFSDFFAHIHNGTLTGSGRLSWNNGWKLQGQINAKSLELQRMFPDSVLTGELFGELSMSMAGTKASLLDKYYRLEGSFEAKDGVIGKLDIETIARFGARPGVAGRTNFSEMSGTLKADSQGQHIYLGKLASTAANTTGLIDIDANQQLSGRLQVDIKGLDSGNIPLRLSGTTVEPILHSGR
ncbi:MAG: hypothetical protein WC236_00300 [Gallionellaceae bacterium]|jgi:hypothetical protein